MTEPPDNVETKEKALVDLLLQILVELKDISTSLKSIARSQAQQATFQKRST